MNPVCRVFAFEDVSTGFFKYPIHGLKSSLADPEFELLFPKSSCKVTPQLKNLLTLAIARILSCSEDEAKSMVDTQHDSFGKLRWKSGMTIHARRVVKTIGRDMSYVKVGVLKICSAKGRS